MKYMVVSLFKNLHIKASNTSMFFGMNCIELLFQKKPPVTVVLMTRSYNSHLYRKVSNFQ